MQYSRMSTIIRLFMLKKELNTSELARATKIPQQTLQKIVTGDCRNPRSSTLEPLAKYFGINLDQLTGEAPIAEEMLAFNLPSNKPQVKDIPLLEWNDVLNLEHALMQKDKQLLTSHHVGEQVFALIMQDITMAPTFPEGSLLIFDPTLKPQDRSYALIYLNDIKEIVFRQILIDANNTYLKPLNPDFATPNLRRLHKDDKVFACLIESRQYFEGNDYQQVIFDRV